MLNFFDRNSLATTSTAARAPIIIHPGAGAARKCWPAERFVSLARILASSGADVRFVIGEVEREQWPQQRIADLHRVSRIEQPQNYLELFEMIREAWLFIGNDSGPTHLAAICGVPTVALFGTDPRRWRPIGPHVHIVRGDSIDLIPLDEVVGTASGAK
jgi:ADP-heptose:LPS heptosyltransferase